MLTGFLLKKGFLSKFVKKIPVLKMSWISVTGSKGRTEWNKLIKVTKADQMTTALFLMSATKVWHVKNRVMLTEAIAKSEPWDEKEKRNPRAEQNGLALHCCSSK